MIGVDMVFRKTFQVRQSSLPYTEAKLQRRSIDESDIVMLVCDPSELQMI